MQTMAPPEETPTERSARIDERFRHVDHRFDEVNRRITEGREETKERFNRLEGDIRQLREVDIRDLKEGDIRELKQGLAAVQTNLNRFVVGAVSGWVVLMVTLLAKGG